MKRKFITSMMAVVILLSLCTVNAFAATEKTLFFNKADDKLYYDAASSQNLDTFLNFQNMNLNQVYEDSLKIKNEANKTYQLFFQILPGDGLSASSLALLKAIDMKIYYSDTLLYQGSADGITKVDGNLDVQQMASIGSFAPGQEETLKVELKLNADDSVNTQGCYYAKSQYLQWEAENFEESKEPAFYSTQKEALAGAQKIGDSEITYHEKSFFSDEAVRELQGVLANTTWKFYAESQHVMLPIDSQPKTGDESVGVFAVTLTAVVALGVVILLGKRKEKSAVE